MTTAFSHHEFAIILTIVITFAMGTFTAVSAWKRPLTRAFGIYTLFISAWAFCWLSYTSTDNAQKSLFYCKVLHIPASFIPPTFLAFAQQLLNIESGRKHLWLRRIFYTTALIFAISCFHPKFVENVIPKLGFNFYEKPGPAYISFFVWFSITVTTTISILLRGLFKCTNKKRNQVSYVVLAYIIGYSGGSTAFLPVYNIPIPTFALYGIPIGHALLFYAIVTQRLLNLGVFVRRASLLMIIYAMLVIIALPAIYYLHQRAIVMTGFDKGLFYMDVGILSIILSLGPFLYAYFVKKSHYFREHTMAGITHELKSPLATIESGIEMLQDNLRTGAPAEKNLEYVDMIHRNAERLKLYVTDLLTLFQVNNKKAILTKKQENLDDICIQAVGELSGLANSKGIKIAFKENGLSHIIHCDRPKILQVINNLLSNAIKYSPEGEIKITLKEEPEKIKFAIEDPGIGIPADEVPYVFDRFFQGRSHSNKGTGIGLTIAKTWVEAHGGEIHAESDGPGKGSRFWFTLPK